MVPGSRAATVADVVARVRGVLDARRPPGTVVLVEGPAGIGKSHLLDRVCDTAGTRVARARADELRGREGFAVARDLVGPAPPGEHPAEHAFATVDSWCDDGPVLLCVDDVHRADAASLGVLRRLAWATVALPLVLVVAARPFPDPPALESLRRLAARHVLGPLDRVAVEAMARDATGAWPGPRLAAVLERAAGNPLFVAEVLRDLVDRGLVGPGGAEGVVDVPPGTAVPGGLADVVRGHVAGLADPERELVGALAVLGSTAGVDELAALLYQPSDLVRQTAGSAARTGMVRLDGDRVAFAHDLYRETVYAALDAPTRRWTHRRASEVVSGPAVTEHRRAGVDGRDPAVGHALAAAARRTSDHAPAVTAELLAQAEPLLEAGDEQIDGLLLERAVALFLAGQGRASAELVEQRLPGVRDRRVAGGLLDVRIRALINSGDVDRALAVIDATLARPELPGPVARGLAQVRCWVLLLDGRLATATAQAAELRRVEDDTSLSAARMTSACAAHLMARPIEALRLIGDVESAPLPSDQLSGRLTALVWPATFTLSAHGPPAAREVIARGRRLSAERGAGWVMPFHAFVAGGAAFAAAQWDEAVAELDTGLELAQEQGSGWISHAVGRRAYVDAHRGDPAAARVRLSAFRDAGLPLQFGHDVPGLADLAVLEAEGTARAAVTLARELWSAAPARGGAWVLAIAPDVARVAHCGTERDLLRRVAADVAAVVADPGCTDATAAPIGDLTAGLASSDRHRVRRAAAVLDAGGWVLAAAHAHEELACLAAAADDRAEALAAADRALAVHERAGATSDRDRLLARLRALGVRRGPRARHVADTRGWAALTPTELRVAELVARGRTNPQIAAALFVSPRTVQTHVAHILAKLGVRSRTEVAAARAG